MELPTVSRQIELFRESDDNEKNNICSNLKILGKKEICDNPFFSFLDKLMTNAELRQYIDKYFGDWTDVETTIMFIKLYQNVEAEFKKNGCPIGSEEIIGIVKGLITTSSYRKEIVNEMRRYQGFDDKKGCLEYVENEIKKIKNK